MRRLSRTAKPADGQTKDTSEGAQTAEAQTYATTQEEENQKQHISRSAGGTSPNREFFITVREYNEVHNGRIKK